MAFPEKGLLTKQIYTHMSSSLDGSEKELSQVRAPPFTSEFRLVRMLESGIPIRHHYCQHGYGCAVERIIVQCSNM